MEGIEKVTGGVDKFGEKVSRHLVGCWLLAWSATCMLCSHPACSDCTFKVMHSAPLHVCADQAEDRMAKGHICADRSR